MRSVIFKLNPGLLFTTIYFLVLPFYRLLVGWARINQNIVADSFVFAAMVYSRIAQTHGNTASITLSDWNYYVYR